MLRGSGCAGKGDAKGRPAQRLGAAAGFAPRSAGRGCRLCNPKVGWGWSGPEAPWPWWRGACLVVDAAKHAVQEGTLEWAVERGQLHDVALPQPHAGRIAQRARRREERGGCGQRRRGEVHTQHGGGAAGQKVRDHCARAGADILRAAGASLKGADKCRGAVHGRCTGVRSWAGRTKTRHAGGSEAAATKAERQELSEAGEADSYDSES